MRRKLLQSITLIFAMLIALSACGDKSTEIIDSEEDNYGNLDFDYREAMQNIHFFEKKISLPATLNNMGEDFTIDERILLPTDTNDLTTTLRYKDETIGNVLLQNCTKEDEDKRSKQIIALTLGDGVNLPSTTSYWYNEIIPIEFLGLTFKSSEYQVRETLGVPSFEKEMPLVNQLYYKNSSEEYLKITVKDSKIVEITFRFTGEN